jgi:tRNA(Leu) C34 or U34 (ribose-2'-O)-methylase TrmL
MGSPPAFSTGAQTLSAVGTVEKRRVVGVEGIQHAVAWTAAQPRLISMEHARDEQEIGVGPHPRPWPDDDRLDPVLLAEGDRRNVVDRYRYWHVEAIVADLDRRRHPFHVAIENWRHDLNIGAVIRNANAFLAAEVHIVGRRRWNRRGAMVTDRYQHIRHHETVGALVEWACGEDLPLVGIDNLPGAVPLAHAEIPRACVLLFGQEGPGLSDAARAAVQAVLSIPQFGSTRSINAGVASGIAMYEWVRRYTSTGCA